MAKVLKHLRSLGYTVCQGGTSHWRVEKDGCLIVTISLTASDHRAWLNMQGDLRRAGIPPLPGKNTPKKAK